MSEPNQKFAYELDSNDIIVAVNEPFMDFARANMSSAVSAHAFVGKRLWEFVQDRSTRHLLMTVVTTARATGRSFELPFRCDSADWRRFLRFRVSLRDNGNVQFTSWVLCEERRAPVALFDPASPKRGRALRVCSWCKKVSAAGSWMEVEKAVEALDLFGAEAVPDLTHGICGDCSRSLQSSLELQGTE